MKEFGCDMAIEDLSGFYPCNCMSSKKEKCCECTSKERPYHVFRSSGTPGMKDGGYFTCNCPCHQSESIEWEKFAEKVSENFDSIYRKFPANEAAVIIRNRIKNSFPSLISQAITTAVAKRDGYLVEEVEKISLRKEVMHDHKYIVEKTGKEIKAEVLSILKH